MFDDLANERDRANQEENPSLYPAMTDWLVEDIDSDDENTDDEAPDGDAAVARIKEALPVPRASLGHIQKITLCGGLTDDAANNANNPKRTILIPSAALFLFRGPALYGINYIEYLACVMFENKPMPKQNRKSDFKTPAHFPMDDDFEGRFDCRHSIRLKQHTPLLIGKKPSHPGTRPPVDAPKSLLNAWKWKADKFAQYHLSLFRPEHMGDNLDYSWETLENFVTSLQNDNTIISKFRLMMMRQHIVGLHTSKLIKKMTLDYRARARTLWTKEDRIKYTDEYLRGLKPRHDPSELQDLVDQLSNGLSSRINKQMGLQLSHDSLQKDTFLRTIQNAETKGLLKTPQQVRNILSIQSTKSLGDLIILAGDMKEWKLSLVEDPPNSTESTTEWTDQNIPSLLGSHLERLNAVRSALLRSDGKNSQQIELFDMYAQYLATSKPSSAMAPPQIVLIHGPPGVGKSKLRDAIVEAHNICGRFVLKSAFNAINATEMGGYTTAYLVKLQGQVSKVCAPILRDLKAEGFNNLSPLVVDEISNQAPWHLGRLSLFGQVATNNFQEFFGGNNVQLYGDYTQLGPVKAGPTIPRALMDIYADPDVRKFLTGRKKKDRSGDTILPSLHKEDERLNANHPYRIGTKIMENARWFELTQQQRAAEDPEHTERVNKTYRGEPVQAFDIKQSIQSLSPEDCSQEEWVNAPVLVATNRERFTLTHERAVAYARFHGTIVIRWLKEFDHWKQEPSLEYRATAMLDPCFYEYYVPGAEGFLTENIHRDLQLVNALAIRYHSIKFDEDTETSLAYDFQNAVPGEVITSPRRPHCINVEVFMSANTPVHVVDALWQFSLRPRPSETTDNSGDQVLPVIPIVEFNCAWDSSPTTVHGSPFFCPSKVLLRQHFPLEPAFAITVHKSEGRTIRRAIIALSHCPAQQCDFTYAQLHVAFSRVKKGSHIRLLLAGKDEVDQWASIVYINFLRPDPAITFFFGGFREISDSDPNKNWKENKWCPIRANTSFRRHMDIPPLPSAQHS